MQLQFNLLKFKIRATHHLADLTLNAVHKVPIRRALVWRVTLVHHQIVDLNV